MNGWVLIIDEWDTDRICLFTDNNPVSDGRIYLVYLSNDNRYYIADGWEPKRFEERKAE